MCQSAIPFAANAPQVVEDSNAPSWPPNILVDCSTTLPIFNCDNEVWAKDVT